jgi:hypothetical protein
LQQHTDISRSLVFKVPFPSGHESSHQAQDALVIDQMPFTPQQSSQHAVATKTMMRHR